MAIRREISENVDRPPSEILALCHRLFEVRVLDALRRYPVYAEKVRQHGGGVPGHGFNIVPSSLPVWTRNDQRELFASLGGAPISGAFVHATGGSAGSPTRFYMTRESYEWRTAVAERGYGWAGAEAGRKSVYVWGAPIKMPSAMKRFQSILLHSLQRRRYINSFRFDDILKAECCRVINRFRPETLVGYAGNLVELALYVRRNPHVLKWKSPTLVTAAEGIRLGQRELLESTLANEVFLSYGSREFMLIGMECREHRGYHVSSDNLFVEVVDDDGQPVALGQTGRILVTDLHNDANPFIRYEIGDLGAWATEPCSCGLPFPLLARVEGRIQEYLVTIDGSRLTALFIPHLMKEFTWVRGYQIEQNQPGKVQVNVLADHEPIALETAPLIAALQAKLGKGSQVDVVRVATLKKGASGKVPIVVKSSLFL